MSTPLRLARDLRLAFPQFHDVRIVRERPWVLRAYCVVTPGREAPAADVEQWVHRHHMATTIFHVEQVTALPPDLIDEEVLLRRTKLKRVVVEEAQVTLKGVLDNLRNAFPGEVLGLSEPGAGISVHVVPNLPPEREEEILSATRLLTICDFPSLTITRQSTPATPLPTVGNLESKATLDQLKADRAFLEDYLPDVLQGDVVPYAAELPGGASTYASVFDGIRNLHQRLALFERVFIFVPFKDEDFPKWAGTTLQEFLAALPTGRIIPVFAHTPDRYEGGLISKILDAGAPRVLFPGEVAIRSIEAFAREHPLLPVFQSEPATVQEVRLALREVSSDPRGEAISAYVEAVADIVRRVGAAALTGPSLGLGWHPIAQWLDAIAQKFGVPSSIQLELGTAIDHRVMNEAVGGRPMSQVGHYLDGHLMFVYGARRGESDLLRVPDPELIGRIAFPDTQGLSLLEFAESFRGPVVDAMRALMSSERVQTATGSEDLLKQFNAELKQYARRADLGYASIATLLTVVGAFALGVPTALGALSLELARRILGRKAPGTLATVASKMTSTTREAVLLARIKAEQSG